MHPEGLQWSYGLAHRRICFRVISGPESLTIIIGFPRLSIAELRVQ
jgi:hypothetical protein